MDKTLDNKGRWRNVIISFRMSPQERDDLNVRVKLSGLTKQDYIIKRLSERDVIVQPNTRVYKALRNQMAEILAELKRINNGTDIDSDLLDIIQITAQTYNGLAEKEKVLMYRQIQKDSESVVKPPLNKDILPHLRRFCNRR